MLRVQPVALEFVGKVWPKVRGFLEAGLKEGNDAPQWSECYNIHHVQGFVAAGTWLLVVAADEQGEVHGAATVSFANQPMQRVAFVSLAGGRFIADRAVMQQFFELLRSRGASKVQGVGRPSIVRLWRRHGFEPRATIFEAQL